MSEEQEPKDRILIAEDDPVSQRVLETLLKKWGYEVLIATDGLEALQLLESREAPRLAVLDWMMPGLEGIQVCRQIRERNAQAYTYIILLPAKTQKKDLLQGLESGADDYLTKPFDPRSCMRGLRVGQRILDLRTDLIAAQEELRFSASHDALTGWRTAAPSGNASPGTRRQDAKGGFFGVIMLDLDHFKRVNDTYGHFCGDAVSEGGSPTNRQSSVRAYDTVGRYGGEEFLVVVPAGAAGSARPGGENSEKNRKRAHQKPRTGMIKVTASLGVAVSNATNSFTPQHCFNWLMGRFIARKGGGATC